MMSLRGIKRFIWPSDGGSTTRVQVLRRARGAIRKHIRTQEGRKRLRKLRIWVSSNLLPVGDREAEVASLASVLTAYAADVAQELALPPSGRVDVRVLETVDDRVEVQVIRPVPAFTTALMPQRLDSVDAPVAATIAVFTVPEAVVPEGVLEVRSGQVIGRVAGPDIVVVAGSRVSARHAAVQFEAGVVLITDAGSLNGSFIGTERLTPHIAHAIHVGDVLRLADVALHLQDLR